MPENLTPEHMRCAAGTCPSVHQLEDGRLLIVGAEAPTDLDGETVFETGARIGQNEAGVIISPDLLSSLPELVRLREALALAKQEINWWVDEHSCCKGHETGVMTAIDAALSSDVGEG